MITSPTTRHWPRGSTASPLFDVFAAPWFAAIYLLLCLAHRVHRSPHHRPGSCPAASAASRAVQARADAGLHRGTADGSAEESIAEAEKWLQAKRWRVRVSDDPVDPWVSAEKGYWRETGNLVFHLSMLVLLAGLGIGGMFGWRGQVIVKEGQGFSNTLTQYDTFSAGRLVNKQDLPPFTVKVDDFWAVFQRGVVTRTGRRGSTRRR